MLATSEPPTSSSLSTSPSISPASSVDAHSAASSDTDVDPEWDSQLVFLPSSHWATAGALKDVLKAGVTALLVVRSDNQGTKGNKVENRGVFIEYALNELKAGGILCEKKWMRVDENPEGKQKVKFVMTDSDHGMKITDIGAVEDEVDEPIITTMAALHVFACAALRSVIHIPSLHGQYALYMLERPTVVFPPLSGSLVLTHSSTHPSRKGHWFSSPGIQGVRADTENPFGVPAPHEWRNLWVAWDMVTLGMIPHTMLLEKPINLRHKCLFYIGHIPTFLDMLLSKGVGGDPTEPKHFWNIFERGIDPHVDDPQTCHHYHSDVPEADEDWPSLLSVISFRDDVRARLMRVYGDLMSGKRAMTRGIARTLVMAFEHEGFHIETLLYMLIQRAGTGTRLPPGFTSPPWHLLASQWSSAPVPHTLSTVLGPSAVVLGHCDSEADDHSLQMEEEHIFGWDNENPRREVWVDKFRVEWRPVSNCEYRKFWEEREGREMPKSWVVADCGEIKVLTIYGPVSFDIAQHWPVLASYDDLAAYARSKGGRLPTEPELRLFLDTYEVGFNGGANVGFRNWHPVPATTGLEENGGKGSNGGVWEWTSTVFNGHEGLSPTKLFPGYSTDFFDGKHQVVLGASYATIPRIAGRRTLRNFYQHNYPYAWVGARIAYDL